MEGVIERFDLRPGYQISRIIKGGWQLSDGHSDNVSASPVADMGAFVDAGIDTFDCADIYTGVEALIGQYLEGAGDAASSVRVHTKYVPDYDALPTLRRADVESIIDRSLHRLGVERLDLVQYHWWRYEVAGCEEAAVWLQELQRAGKINLLSVTNFNTAYTRRILDSGVALATAQVQYSLLDSRPEKELVGLCREHDMYLLCYGTLAGGFLSDRWLGVTAPRDFENRSLRKYFLMIEEAGGWDAFQALLTALSAIGRKHGVGIAAVASRWVLEQQRVAAVIIGARNADHLQRYRELFSFALDEADLAAIAAVRSQLAEPPLDVFDLERDKEGRHGSIMKYNLNAE